MALAPKPATRDRLGKIPAEPVYHGVHAFPIALVPKPAATLGKIEMETVYHSDSARKRGNHAKTRDLRAVWENPQWNSLIMAIAEKSPIGSANLFGSAKPWGLAEQEVMAVVVGAIDDDRPRHLLSPFLGV